MSISSNAAKEKMVILFSERSGEVVQILKEAGIDPTRDFRYRNFAGADFGTCDIARWDFSGAILRKAKLAGVKNIHLAVFDTETDLAGAELPKGVSADLLKRG